MAQRVRDILLRIRGDASDAENDLHQLARELKQFDGITAEATVDINTQAAERKVKSAKDAVQAFGRMSEEAKVDLQARAAQVKLDGLNRNLDNLQKREVTPKVEIAIGKTVAQIERVEAQLDKLDRRRVDINVDVDRRGLGRGIGAGAGVIGAGAAVVSAGARGLGAFAAAATTATEAFGAFVSVVSRGFGVIGGLANLFIQAGITGLALVGAFAQMGVAGLALGAALAAVGAGLAIFTAGALLQGVLLLTGAVVALAASFLTAAAGVGVLATALAAAFGPVLLVAIAAMARFAKILEAVKSREDDVAEGARGVRDANRAQADAQRNAVDAAARVRTTAVEAYRAWRDAAEEASDAIRGIAQAELSRDQARLNVERAEENLRSLREEAGLTSTSLDGLFKKFTDISFRPQNLIAAIQKSQVGQQAGASELDIQQGILDLRQARLNEKDAIDGVSDAHTRLEDARTREQEFIRQGIDAYEPYTAAVDANAKAQRAVAEATETTAEARDKQNEKLKDLTPQERRLVDVLIRLKDTLTDVFRPATRAVFDGLLDALEDLSDFAKDTGVRRGLRDVGLAVGGMFRGLGRELRRRETREAFAEFARGGAAIIRELTPVFRHLSRLILAVAREAMPWLLEIIREIGRRFRRWADDVSASDIEDFVRRVRRSFTIWWGIVKELWKTVKAFFGDANDSGDELAGHIRDILRRFRLWLEENPDKIKTFFEDAAKFGKDLADAMVIIVDMLKWMVNAKEDIEDVFGSITQKGRHFDPGRPTGAEGLDFWPFQSGGRIPGTGRGDRVPILAEPGEFMIRRSVAQSIGIGRLNLLNSGNLAAIGGSRAGMVINEQIINLPPAPGHGQLGDPRHQAVQLARELRRRGGQSLPGGGVR